MSDNECPTTTTGDANLTGSLEVLGSGLDIVCSHPVRTWNMELIVELNGDLLNKLSDFCPMSLNESHPSGLSQPMSSVRAHLLVDLYLASVT